jgi:endonuclease YncB( thermonuclease family)
LTLQTITNGSCIPSDTKREVGVVKRVIDGDTIVVEIGGVEYKVRYIGMDAAESWDAVGQASTEQNKKLVLNKTVLLVKDKSETDRYDRLLRYVIVGNIFVNEYLTRLGLAEAASYPPDTACDIQFNSSQEFALRNQVGVWAQFKITPNSRSGGWITSCNCSIDYDCADFSSQAAAQACFNQCGGSRYYNWSGLDRDRDGKACESLP